MATPHKFYTSFWQVIDKFDGCWFPKSQSNRPKIGKGQEGRRKFWNDFLAEFPIYERPRESMLIQVKAEYCGERFATF